jgi:nucleoside-diphosphate-sugar epimerase
MTNMVNLNRLSWHRLVADAVLVATATVIACSLHLLRNLGLGREMLLGYIHFPPVPLDAEEALVDFELRLAVLLLVVPASLTTFYLRGFYTDGNNYRRRPKPLTIIESASIAYLAFGAVVYLVAPSQLVPRLIFITGWLVTVVLLLGSRVWSSTWRDAILREEQSRRRSGHAPIRRVLVVGGAGYIGSALVRQLLDKNYLVRVLDPLMYGDGPIVDVKGHPRFELQHGDSRSVEAVVNAFRDIDAVIHLGAIVGDSACALDERLTLETNVVATRMMAEVAKGYGVRRFVFASTCSVYGASDGKLDESSSLNPVSLYARSKIACERVLNGMADETFCPVIYRFATIYGLSPRPRFDLAVNLLTAKAVTEGTFTVFGGDQWRPFVHVTDVARALVLALEVEQHLISGKTFNIGSNEQNYRMREIGELVETLVPQARMVVDRSSPDARNYWVRFDKAKDILGFAASLTVQDGIKEIAAALNAGRILDYRSPLYNNSAFLSDVRNRTAANLSSPIFELSGYVPSQPEQGEEVKVALTPS